MRTFAEKPKANQQATSPKTTVPAWPHLEHSHEVNSILHLQRTIGNKAVQRMLQSNVEERNNILTDTASPHFGHDFSRIPIHPPAAGAIQTKLAINTPGDEYEQEADRVAEQVMRMPESQVRRKCSAPGCKDEDDEKKLQQTKPASAGEAGSQVDHSLIQNVLASPGQRLDTATRSFMEPRFGHDFSEVRVHTDGRAAESARAVNARAYTVGRDVVFGEGQYVPGSDEGRKLVAHELAHVGQNNKNTLQRYDDDELDAGVPLPGGVREEPQVEQEPVQQESQPERREARPSPPACTTRYQRATNFQSLIDLVRAAETRLNAAGITSTREQVHALRGIYYGTTWSQDYAVERSTTRNEGFQRFTRPSVDPSRSVPRDIQPLLDCGLFAALQSSQDIVDGNRHVDFGHLIIGLDARYDPAFSSNIQYPVMLMSIDLGGTGPELVTWLGDLGGGAAALASRRVSTPGTNVRSVFTGTDYGGSINLEGDIAGFVVATSGSTRPTAPIAPAFAPGRGRLSDVLQDYLSPNRPSSSWTGRATTFLRMYGGTFDASSNALTNRATLITTFSDKIQVFACNYLASRVRDGHLTYTQATVAANHVIPASREVATAFVNALEDSHRTGSRIEARRFPSPSPAGPGACRQQLVAGRLLGIFSK